MDFLSYTATITGKKMGGESKVKPTQELALRILFGSLAQSLERNVSSVPSPSPTDFGLAVHKIKMLSSSKPLPTTLSSNSVRISFLADSERY